jgi:hypothetical protein
MNSPSTTIRNTPNEIPVIRANVASSSTYTAASSGEWDASFRPERSTDLGFTVRTLSICWQWGSG